MFLTDTRHSCCRVASFSYKQIQGRLHVCTLLGISSRQYPVVASKLTSLCRFMLLCLLQIGAAVGLPFPQWYEAGAAPLPSTVHGEWSFGKLLYQAGW